MRQLGNGRWDKILIRKMLELSEADTWEEAKEEWKASGDVWWGSSTSAPEWVVNSGHRGQCLCGHRVVYHFRIINMVNGNEEVVGSDHITAYLILRHLADERGIPINTLTEADADEWIKAHVADMKAEAWFAENGELFNEYFEKVRLLDQEVNAKYVGNYYDRDLNQSVARYRPLKKSSGKYGTSNYRMASIVWRWNALDNPKRQSLTRGYPNDKLWADLVYFANTCDEQLEAFNARLERREQRRVEVAEARREAEERRIQRQIEWEAGREERERLAQIQRREQRRLEELRRRNATKSRMDRINTMWANNKEHLINMHEYYGIPPMDSILVDDTQDGIDVLSMLESIISNGQFPIGRCKRVFSKWQTDQQRKMLDELKQNGLISEKEWKSVDDRLSAQKLIAQHLGELNYEWGALNTENKVEHTRESD